MTTGSGWDPLLGQLNGLVGVCGPDGTLRAVTGQLWSQLPAAGRTRSLLQLVHEGQEPGFAEIVRQVATGARPSTRVMVALRVEDTRWYLAELSPLPDEQVLVVWLPTEDLTELDSAAPDDAAPEPDAPSDEFLELEEFEPVDDEDTLQDHVATPMIADTRDEFAGYGFDIAEVAEEAREPVVPRRVERGETAQLRDARAPLPAPPALSQGEALKPLDARLVIVAPLSLRFTAARLQRAFDMATTKTAVWFDDDFNRKAKRLSETSRVVFLGSSRYADFLRKVVEPRFKDLGARWGLLPRKALVWVERNPDLLRPQVQHACDAVLKSVAKEEEYASIRLRTKVDPSTPGSRLAARFLLDESPHRSHVDELLLHFAIATFLREAWSEFVGDALIGD